MKAIKALIYLTLVGMFFSTSMHAEIMDKIVAIVNDEVITLSELNAAFEPYQKKIEGSYGEGGRDKIMEEAKRMMLDRMIDHILVQQESKKTGIAVSDDEVSETIRNILSREKIQMDELIKNLAREGTTFENYKKDVKDQLLRTKLVMREIKSKITVNEEEIGTYYNKHREEYEGKKAVRIKQILIMIPRNPDEKTKASKRAEIENIHNRLKSGESFEILAFNHSQDPAAKTGGDIGFVEKGTMFPAVEDVAFSLEKNEISNVIESPIGFHIIKVVDKRGAGAKSIESVRNEIKWKLEQQKMETKYEEWIKELRQKSHIKIKL